MVISQERQKVSTGPSSIIMTSASSKVMTLPHDRNVHIIQHGSCTSYFTAYRQIADIDPT